MYPNTYVFSEPSTWTLVSRVTTRSVHTDPDETTTVFPNSSVYYDVKIPFRDIGWRFEPYTKKHFYIGVTVRLKYCDGNSSLHWTQLGVAKIFSETELAVQHSTASLHPGKPDHPECQGEAPAELERPQ